MTSDSNFDIFGSNDSEAPLCDAANLSSLLSDAAPPAIALPKGGKELRAAQRYIVKWRVTAFIDHRGLHHGVIKDISTKGTAILFEQNFQSVEFIKLHIYVTPPAPSKIPCVIEVLGRIIYAIHDPKEHRFRTGVNFLKFSTEHDPAFLADHLDNHAMTVIG
ncbi:MAG TPA: PilZ domain-containing protein [Gallionella sp.]|nr:PilZ domain-containing protein [Gallionella sp.]